VFGGAGGAAGGFGSSGSSGVTASISGPMNGPSIVLRAGGGGGGSGPYMSGIGFVTFPATGTRLGPSS
jgi:hypothetical protein